jgi:hypothetical protein
MGKEVGGGRAPAGGVKLGSGGGRVCVSVRVKVSRLHAGYTRGQSIV